MIEKIGIGLWLVFIITCIIGFVASSGNKEKSVLDRLEHIEQTLKINK